IAATAFAGVPAQQVAYTQPGPRNGMPEDGLLQRGSVDDGQPQQVGQVARVDPAIAVGLGKAHVAAAQNTGTGAPVVDAQI
ncbi:hypothetical protein, partial [Brucella gallinifaecis]|uniref:hypothetical protein n=1 Tax=Brucella gallinifaecis TaxID=215590 RepID=UPI00235E693A